MILKFPDLDILKHALLSGTVPPALSTAPATVGSDGDNLLWIVPSVAPTRKVQDELRKLGVHVGKSTGTEEGTVVSCWLELLPLIKEQDVVAPPDKTAVLFDLADAEQLARLATEILRLGNDRQSYRRLESADGSERLLLQVIGPPYYSLLRALDDHEAGAPRAYVEKVGRVWVQLGYAHPLADRIKPPPGQLLLLSPPGVWTLLPEAPFRNIYEVVAFELPGVAAACRETELDTRLKVRLRLTRGSGTEPAELWVLRNDPVATLNELVQNSDDELLGRLSFAVGESRGQPLVLLKVRPSRQAPPEVVLDAIGYHTYLKMPNLFVPVGARIHPPLRRDVVRKLLADDPDTLTWLHPEGDGKFTPEIIRADAFRPLTDWVDYLIDHERQPLTTWVQSMTFDFEQFICSDEATPKKPKAPPTEKTRGQGQRGPGSPHDVAAPVKEPNKARDDQTAFTEELTLLPVEPSAQKIRLTELESQFVQIDGPIDVPERVALWPEMALLNAVLKNVEDASLCWLNALWHADDWPEIWLWAWFRNEAQQVAPRPGKTHSWTAQALRSGQPTPITGDDLDRVLALPEPSSADVRALAAYLVWASRCPTRPAALDAARLNAIQRFLDAQDTELPVRACWLTWQAFARLSNDDVLALARARDALLLRLFNSGLQPGRDMPTFLKFAGQPNSQRFRGVRPWLLGLCQTACDWSRAANAAQPTEGDAPTLAYIRLLFAYALAKLGEQEASRDLIDAAKKVLGREEPHQFLLQAFVYRIHLVQEGRQNLGPLSGELMEYLDKTLSPPAGSSQAQDDATKQKRMIRYVIDRLRQRLRVLEPIDKVDPYLHWEAKTDELATRLAEVVRLTDRRAIADTVLKLLREAPKGAKGHEVRARILRTALEVAPRVTEEFGLEILTAFGPTWEGLPEVVEVGTLIERAELLERGLFVAAHFGKTEHVQAMVKRFQTLLREHKGGMQSLKAVEKLAGESLRGLRKLGMREEIDSLLELMAAVILQGDDLSAAAAKHERNWPAGLRALLHVAGGWLYFGRERRAEPIIAAARALLAEQELSLQEQTALAVVYARTLGSATVEVIQKRLEELFEIVPNIRDSKTTIKYYSLMQLEVAEAVVLAIAGDDASFGADARRWLDDDEFTVRRRIHRDFHTAKATNVH